VKSG